LGVNKSGNMACDCRIRVKIGPLMAKLSFSLVITTFLLFIPATSVVGQSGAGYIVANQYDINSGLSGNNVHEIIQDSYGFIWLATRNGLNRFDGKNFKVYQSQPGQIPSISSSFVWTMLEDSKQNFWVGTSGGGLNLYDRSSGRFYEFANDPNNPASLSHDTVTSLYEDMNGTLWVGTEGGGINRLDWFEVSGESASAYFKRYSDSYNPEKGFDADIVLDITESENGDLWFATYGGGVIKFDRQTETFHTISDTLGRYAMSVHFDDKGRLFTGTKYDGLIIYDVRINSISNPEIIFQSNPDSSNFIWPITTDSNGNVWIGTFGQGLLRTEAFDKGGLRIEDQFHDEGQHILSIFEDNHGMIWVGTDNSGVFNIVKQDRFLTPNWIFEGGELPDRFIILSYLEDRNQNRWLGTHRGLFVQNSGSAKFKRFGKIDETKQIEHIMESSDGGLFISTNAGLYHYEVSAGLLQTIRLGEPLSDTPLIDRVNHVLEVDESYWISTNHGLIRLDHNFQKIHHYSDSGDPAGRLSGNNIIKTVYADQKLWVLAAHNGLNVIQPDDSIEQITLDTHSERGLLSNRVSDIAITDSGDIWVSTLDAGLFQYDLETDQFTQHLLSGSERSNTINRLLPVGNDKLLASTADGLHGFYIDRKESVRFFFHRGNRVQFTNRLFESESQGILVTKDLGARFLNLDTFLTTDNYRNPVHFTDIQVNYESVNLYNDEITREGLVLQHDQRSLLFEFALLDYHFPSLNRYEYILEGLDDDWIRAGDRYSANYSNLPSGHYTFRVRGQGPGGVASLSVLDMPVYIATPFWERVWFRAFLIISTLLIGYGLYRYRLKHMLKEEKVRLNLAKDLHDDVSSTLSSIHFFAQAIEKPESQIAEKKRFLKLIKQSSEEAREKMNDIIWVIHPQDDNWETLLLKCKRYAADILDSKNIGYQFTVEGEPPSTLRLVVKKNTWLIFKELITNVVKHSNANNVEIKFQVDRQHIVLSVNDNGDGFDPDENREEGFGLKNIQNRVKSLKGNIQLNSVLGRGTEWELKYPA
jgi:ligand-binding sensor domain-containing protein